MAVSNFLGSRAERQRRERARRSEQLQIRIVAPGDVENPFAWSALMTGVAFLVVGALKSRFVEQS